MEQTNHTSDWEVSDDLWRKLQPLLPMRSLRPHGGRPPADDRQMLGAVLHILRIGAPWSSVPRDLGASSTVYGRFRSWELDGFFQRIWESGLHAHPELAELNWQNMGTSGYMTHERVETSSGTRATRAPRSHAPAASVTQRASSPQITSHQSALGCAVAEKTVARKLETPRLPKLHLVRDHLIAKIEQCLGTEHPSSQVLLVSAPAGYGKTTLLAQWAERTAAPVAWYHLDSGDNDPAMFLRGIVAAVRTQHPRSLWNVQSFLDNLSQGTMPAGDISRASSLLIADLARHITRPMILILTGAGGLEKTSPTLDVLDQILARPSDNLRVALEFREVPAASFALLVTHHRVQGIGRLDLRFSDEESDQLLDLLAAPTDSAYRTQVKDLCTGWITGILLSTRRLWPEQLIPPGEEIDREAVFHYLAAQVIDNLPPLLRDFAAEAAVLNFMTPALCAKLLHLPIPVARERLGSLDRHTGFVTHSSGGESQEVTYRFQPLLRGALLDRLDASGKDLGSNSRRTLHLRAGALLADEGDMEEAIWHYTQGEAYDEIADLIIQSRDTLLQTGQGRRLLCWLDLLPSSVRDQHPDLYILLAELWRKTGQQQQSLAAASRACALFESPARPAELRMAAEAFVARARINYTVGLYQQARDDCHRALSILAEADPAEPGRDALYGEVYDSLATATAHLEGTAAAEPILRECERHYLRSGNLRKLGRHQYRRSNLYIQQGDMARAEQAATTALLAAQATRNVVSAICSHLNLGAVKMRTRRLHDAQIDFETALVQAQAAHYPTGVGYALGNLADLALCMGDYEQAIDLYERVLQQVSIHQIGHLRACAFSGLGYALSLSGRSSEAVIRLTAAVDDRRGQASSLTLDEIILDLAMGFAYCSDGMYPLAEATLSQTAQLAECRGFLRQTAEAFLFLTSAALSQHEPEAAGIHLQRMLEVAAQTPDPTCITFELLYVPQVWTLLEQSDNPIASALVGALGQMRAGIRESRSAASHSVGTVSSHDSSHDSSHEMLVEVVPPTLEVSPASQDGPRLPVRVYMLGDARVLVGTRYVETWRKPAARDLLLFLLHQQKPVTRDNIIAALWPDEDPAQATKWLWSAAHHLRRVLGGDALTRDSRGHFSLGIDCWVDVEQFTLLVGQGRAHLKQGRLRAAARAFEQALTYWNGPYLADISLELARGPASCNRRGRAYLSDAIGIDGVSARRAGKSGSTFSACAGVGSALRTGASRSHALLRGHWRDCPGHPAVRSLRTYSSRGTRS